jgi:hypothetical protein
MPRPSEADAIDSAAWLVDRPSPLTLQEPRNADGASQRSRRRTDSDNPQGNGQNLIPAVPERLKDRKRRSQAYRGNDREQGRGRKACDERRRPKACKTVEASRQGIDCDVPAQRSHE